jgi:hypothetical protein
MALLWALGAFGLLLGLGRRFGSVLRVAVLGAEIGGLWRAGGTLPCAVLVRVLWVGWLLMCAVAWWDDRCLPW